MSPPSPVMSWGRPSPAPGLVGSITLPWRQLCLQQGQPPLHASAIDSQISVSQARAAVDRQCRGAVTVAVVDESNADVVGEAEQARTLDQLPTPAVFGAHANLDARDRTSTRLNSSH